jgi:hypothetical protein
VTDVFRGFSQSLQENAGIILELGHGCFYPNPCQFIIHHPLLCNRDNETAVKLSTEFYEPVWKANESEY